MRLFSGIRERVDAFLHDEKLKKKLYIIIFESDTPMGKLFDTCLIGFIIASVLVVVLESIRSFSYHYTLGLRILEYVFTAFFTFEYLVRIYCSPKPKKYIFSFFGIVDLLSTLPVYLSFFFAGTRYLLVIRALRISAPKIFVFFFFVLILVTSIGTIMYMIEGNQPGTQFNNIPNSIYWAIVTMTTVGYGDITPVTPVGRFLSAIVMLIGYTIIAVPTGIVSATMVGEQRKKNRMECPHCHRTGHEEEAEYCKYCGSKLDQEETGK